MISKKPFLSLVFTFLSIIAFAQDEDVFGISEKAKNPKSESAVGNVARNVLEMFSVEISGGAAYNQFATSFYSANPSLYPNFTQFQNFDTPLDISEENPLEMKSSDWTFPLLNAGLRINLFNLLTIGGGYGQEWGNMSTMRGGDFEFAFEGGSYQASKLYGTVGLVLYDAKRRQAFLRWKYRKYASANYYMQSELTQRSRQVYPWRFILEGEFGQLKIKNFYEQTTMMDVPNYEPKLAVGDKPYMGIALRVERDFSEYTKMFIKGGAEFRDFTYSASDFSEVQDLKQTLYGMQVGFAVRFPGTKRCKIGGCGVVMKHMHNGIEYRGSGIFNYQNRKVGQWY
ncbi:hypothetical protein FHS59_001332 [Algoriphagus iocasae]|uniref:DUF4421 domain-containing protein n=1 Tax=Algoriphagus iocasae TaxID=1836499 RepID=A0A841MJS7_9BACT|nr:hypothetical protein [Algoriphagus iocasae]MBB6325717.1 hypothetical protein [Algoriphagus iocasae]